MSTENAFLQDIRSHPDDDSACLIYADWLEEQGQEKRAEFIRVQCELGRLPEGHPRQRKLVVRERRLLSQEWTQPVADLVPGEPLVAMSGYGKARKPPTDLRTWGVVFRRGVIDELIVPARLLPRDAGKLEQLPSLRALGVNDISGNERLAGQIAALPLLNRLEALRFEEPLGVFSAGWDRLLPLDQGYNLGAGLGLQGLRQLLTSPHLKGLRTLELPNNGIQEAAVLELAQTSALGSIRSLNLSSNYGNYATRDPVALRALAASEPFAGLRRLDFHNTYLGREGLLVLRSARFLPHLVELDLSQSRLLLNGVRELFRSVPLEGLKVLKLNRLNQQISMVKELVKCPGLRNLEVLELNWNRIGEPGAKLLAECPFLSNLKVLRLRHNRLTLAGVEALATSPHLQKLEVLELGSNLRKQEQEQLRQRFGKGFGIF